MKKILITILVLTLVLVSCVSAFAWTESWTIDPSNGGTWKKSPTNHAMPNSGSYWKATFNEPASSSSAYIYKKSSGRATHIEAFSKNIERSGLEYLSGMKVVGDIYWLVGSGTYGSTVSYTYSF